MRFMMVTISSSGANGASDACTVNLVRPSEVSHNWAQRALHTKPLASEDLTMAAKTIVRARIDARLKEEASAILGAVGLTISDAVRMMLVRIVADRALPFDPLLPNEETIEAMKAARQGELVTAGAVDELFADLRADD